MLLVLFGVEDRVLAEREVFADRGPISSGFPPAEVRARIRPSVVEAARGVGSLDLEQMMRPPAVRFVRSPGDDLSLQLVRGRGDVFGFRLPADPALAERI